MKKIFRMASVIALACASLTYTSCTKDYDEEINKVNQSVDALQSKLQGEIDGLKGDVASLKSGLSSLESAYKAADAALQKGIDANASAIAALTSKVAANETAIAQLNATVATLATKDELAAKAGELETKIAAVATDLASAKEEILAKATALETELNAVKEQVAADEAKLAAVEEALAAIQDVYAACSDELRSIVFIPDLYFAGIEATEYTFSYVEGLVYQYYTKNNKKAELSYKVGIEGTTGETDITIAAGMPTGSGWDVIGRDKDGRDIYDDYTVGSLGLAKYNLNPSSFNVDKAEWALYGADYQYVTKGEEAKETWKPVFEGINVVNGVAEVAYSIENAEKMYATVDSVDGGSRGLVKLGVVPVMNLVATLDSAKTVSSDYEAILTNYVEPEALAFAQENKYITHNTFCELPKNNKELYETVESAIGYVASVPVVYNVGSVNLADYITVHMDSEIYGEYEATVAELNEQFNGRYELVFNNIKYTVGEETTSEDMYLDITKEGVATPMYVKTGKNPTSTPCGVNTTEGRSSVGRHPVALVTLYDNEHKDKDGNPQIVLTGFFKMEIVEDEREVVVEIPNLGKAPYICDSVEFSTNWHQFSDLVLETLGVSYKEFTSGFDVETYESDSVVVYVKVTDKDGVESFVDSINIGTEKKPEIVCVKDYYGSVEYNEDSATNGVNNAFVWAAEPQGIGAGNTQSVYVHFTRGEYEDVWVELTVTVAPKAKYIYGIKLENEWYTGMVHCDVNEPNTVLANVPVPVATETNGGDVTKYSRNINDYLYGSKASVVLTEDSDPVYAEILAGKSSLYAGTDAKKKEGKDNIEASIAYTFSAEQPIINGVQLLTNEDGNKLYAATYDDEGNIVKTKNAEDEDVPVLNESELIACFDAEKPTVITYSWAEGNTTAKKLLNLWGYKETDETKMLYANIDVAIKYGECGIDAGEDHFHVRFVRPLVIGTADQSINEESQVDGANVEIVKFITGITDWNNQPVVVDSLDKAGKKTGNIIEAEIKTVNMYKYYKISKLNIKLDEAERTNTGKGEWEKLAEATPNAKLAVGTVSAKGVFTASTETSVDITNFKSLKGLVINYKNNSAVVKDFKIRIPVAYEYAWGVIEDYFYINVKATPETKPGA